MQNDKWIGLSWVCILLLANSFTLLSQTLSLVLFFSRLSKLYPKYNNPIKVLSLLVLLDGGWRNRKTVILT